jgi:hypothetical protein
VSVHRLRHGISTDPYTRVPNVAINSLPPKSLGLYVFMLSKPEDWRFREVTIAKQMGVSRAQIRTAMADLIAAGWVTRRRQLENGVPIMDTTVHDQKQSESDQSTENERTESVPLSNKRGSNKKDESSGQSDQTSDVATGKQTESSKSAIQQKHTETVNVEETDSSYPARLLQELENANLAPDLDEERLADNYLKLHQAAKQAGKAMDGVTIALTLALLERTFGAMPKQARGMVARLVKANGPTAVMQAAVTTAGSSVGMDPKYGDDPLGPVRYLAGVARGRL